ncbi:hypothetical protein R1flu_003788 [Riccia fluitans]|uniref:Uncharacterized protein n=1 Tax=Riccia fluitans TaxID=41844 RepID=A0ABD1YA59_9MARC
MAGDAVKLSTSIIKWARDLFNCCIEVGGLRERDIVERSFAREEGRHERTENRGSRHDDLGHDTIDVRSLSSCCSLWDRQLHDFSTSIYSPIPRRISCNALTRNSSAAAAPESLFSQVSLHVYSHFVRSSSSCGALASLCSS